MKKIVLTVAVTGLFMVGCAEKPMAKSVVELAGNKTVSGWQDQNNASAQPQKVVAKKVIKCEPMKDTDGDGVPDNLDKCPNTPNNMLVDHNGCPIIKTLRLNFDFNKADVKKIYYSDLKEIADILKNNPDLKVEIAGYTDNVGSEEYNAKLSQKRAEAVKKVLIKVYGIDAKKLTAKGYGEKYPLVPNTTDTNRALNRRVEIVNITSKK